MKRNNQQDNMKYQHSKHAVEQVQNRHLDKAVIDSALSKPDKQLVDTTGLTVYHKLARENGKYYLYRVFVNHDKRGPLW